MPATETPQASQNLICNMGVRFSREDFDALTALAASLGLTPAQMLRKILKRGLTEEWTGEPEEAGQQ